jgi:mRNA-degrading endonuclease toxin of MazEF toxin-antitoxin module
MNEEYKKNFDAWNKYAKSLEEAEHTGLFHERDIWWCALGTNIGSEDDGKNSQFERPVLIFRKFGGETSWIIPISSQKCRRDSRIQYPISVQGMSRTARLHQLRLISNKRMLRYVDSVSIEDFTKIRRMIADLA